MIVAERLDERLQVKKAAKTILDSMRYAEMNFYDLYACEKEIKTIPPTLLPALFSSDDYEKVSYSEHSCKYVKYDKDKKELLVKWSNFSNELEGIADNLFDLLFDILLESKMDENFLDRLRRLAE